MEMQIPNGFELKESKIANAGLGIFATKDIEADICIGLYKGVWLTVNDFDNMSDQEKEVGLIYGWEIRDYYGNKNREKGTRLKDNNIIGYIDGSCIDKSNFLRYINHPQIISDENIKASQFRDKIYYITKKSIKKGDELYVNYGDVYGDFLANP